jgi:hypothetical protein
MYQLHYDEEQPDVEVKIKHLLDLSSPKKVIENAKRYFDNPDIKVYLSSSKTSKYAIYDPVNKKMFHFGNIYYEDYSKHLSETHRKNYILRASHIKDIGKITSIHQTI